MKHTRVTSAWRPVRAQRSRRRGLDGALSALAFNICLLLLPLAGAAALIVIARDNLYAYEFSDEAARAVAQRVARLNGELIQVDFDRQNQWDSLVDMELRANDMHAARGFLLSGAGMLPRRAAQVLNQTDANDAELEIAALQLLTPSTRARYQDAGPLLSQRDATTATPAPAAASPEDFELLARALLAEPETDTLQFVLTGFSLGLAGDLSPDMALGIEALRDASRREDFPQGLSGEIHALFETALPLTVFRDAARARAPNTAGAGAYANASAAFSEVATPERAARARAFLDQLGGISRATSRAGAAALLTHATTLRDLPRLSLLANAAGDRAVAAAKRLPRDGRLVGAARGQLTVTQDLMATLVLAGAALFGLVLIVMIKAVQGALGAVRRFRAENDEDYEYGGGQLVEISTNNWRPLN